MASGIIQSDAHRALGDQILALRFQSEKRKQGAVIVDSATQVDVKPGESWIVVSGRYPQEGIRFHVLLGGDKSSELLYKRVIEQ